jgi:hypothetical protein
MGPHPSGIPVSDFRLVRVARRCMSSIKVCYSLSIVQRVENSRRLQQCYDGPFLSHRIVSWQSNHFAPSLIVPHKLSVSLGLCLSALLQAKLLGLAIIMSLCMVRGQLSQTTATQIWIVPTRVSHSLLRSSVSWDTSNTRVSAASESRSRQIFPVNTPESLPF